MKNRDKNLDDELAALAQKSDEDIDTSDIPEIKDWSGAVIGKFYGKTQASASYPELLIIQNWFKTFMKPGTVITNPSKLAEWLVSMATDKSDELVLTSCDFMEPPSEWIDVSVIPEDGVYEVVVAHAGKEEYIEGASYSGNTEPEWVLASDPYAVMMDLEVTRYRKFGPMPPPITRHPSKYEPTRIRAEVR